MGMEDGCAYIRMNLLGVFRQLCGVGERLFATEVNPLCLANTLTVFCYEDWAASFREVVKRYGVSDVRFPFCTIPSALTRSMCSKRSLKFENSASQPGQIIVAGSARLWM